MTDKGDKGPRKPGDKSENFLSTDAGFRGLTEKEQKFLNESKGSIAGTGIGGTDKLQGICKYARAPGEVYLSAEKHGQSCGITMGGYRPASIHGKRIKQSGTATIDLVAGRMGSYATSVIKQSPKGEPAMCDNNYKVDAARVTICQKGDPDQDFGCRPGNVGTLIGRSFVAMKGDTIRIIGRESVKIVSGTDDENAQSGKIDNPRGIDLVGGNDDADMQPLVKGNSLLESLNDILAEIEQLSGIVIDFMTAQMIYNSVVALHVHEVPFSPSISLISVGYIPLVINNLGITLPSMIFNRINIWGTRFQYLTPKIGRLDKFVLSRYNSTN
jgi:hypothetical protein